MSTETTQQEFWTLHASAGSMTYCASCALRASNVGFLASGYRPVETMLEAAQTFNHLTSDQPGVGIEFKGQEGPCENERHDHWTSSNTDTQQEER